MNKIYQTAIVGGGAAGLMAAVELTCGNNAINGEDVLLLERNDRVGKKLVATGNGQGNLLNAKVDAKYYHGDKSFIGAFIDNQNQINLSSYLENLGIVLTENKDGKIYPLSKQASAVLDLLRAIIKSKGVEERVNSQVKQIKKEKDYYKLVLENGVYLAKNVIFAVGGCSAKQFGTDGTAYSLIENLGHKKTKLYPSLVQLKTETEKIKGLKGLKESATVWAITSDGKACSTGDLLFTEFGVSGSAVFNVSSFVAGKENATLKIEFVPEKSQEELKEIIKSRLNKPEIFGENLLVGIVNKRIGQALLKSASKVDAEGVANAVKNFTLKVTGNLGFNYSQVTHGGIITKDIDEKTYESKINKGLFVVGEVLDVDGDCGGYNLAFAFVSGIKSAREIKSRGK